MSIASHPAHATSTFDPVSSTAIEKDHVESRWALAGVARTPLAHCRDLLVEARPPVVAIFAVRMLAAINVEKLLSVQRVGLVAAWIALTVSVYVFNGLSDLDGDRRNGSTRPLASGRMSRRAALVSCGLLATGSLLVCWWCGTPEGLAATASLLIGWAYSAGPSWKASPVGFAVTIVGGAGLTYLAGCWESGQSLGFQLSLIVVALWVGVCSGAKDFSDIDGDRLAGRRTWPVLFGPQRAAWMVSGLATCALVVVGVVTADEAPRDLPAVGILILGTALYIASLLHMHDTGDRADMRRPYKAFMLTQFAFNFALIGCGL